MAADTVPPTHPIPVASSIMPGRPGRFNRSAEVEAAVNRMLGKRPGGAWFVLVVIGALWLGTGVPSSRIGLLFLAIGLIGMIRDVRRHVRIREMAEREVGHG
jgi:hypothetical protein